MLIARKTLCQLERTAATAVLPVRRFILYRSIIEHIPSVPFDNVDSLSSSSCIWFASWALRSRSSIRLFNSTFFSLTRARSAGGCGPPGPDIEGWRRLEDGARCMVTNGVPLCSQIDTGRLSTPTPVFARARSRQCRVDFVTRKVRCPLQPVFNRQVLTVPWTI